MRGVSEVLGAFMVLIIVMGMAAVWLTVEAPRINRETMGIIEALRMAARRQRQLLSLLYYYKTSDATPKLRLYVYNYGLEKSTIKEDKGLIVAGQVVPRASITMVDADTGQAIADYVINPKQVVMIEVNAPADEVFDVILQTEEGGLFIWELKAE